MSTSSQFYTGADPSYFQPPEEVRKYGLRNLCRIIAAAVVLGLIVSIGMVFIGARLLWQTPAAPTQAEVRVPRRIRPEVHLATGIQEPEIERHGVRHHAAIGAESE